MPTTALRIGRVAFASTLALTLAGPLAPRSAAAQSHPPQPWERRSRSSVSIGGDAVYTSVGARDGAIGDGVGFDAHAGLDISALSLGAGYQRTSHDLTGTSHSAVYDGFYVEPRVRRRVRELPGREAGGGPPPPPPPTPPPQPNRQSPTLRPNALAGGAGR
jgi:hypothetical protein